MFPASVVLKIIAPNVVVGIAALSFGAPVCGLGGAQNYATVLALRFLSRCAQSFIQGMTIVCASYAETLEFHINDSLTTSIAMVVRSTNSFDSTRRSGLQRRGCYGPRYVLPTSYTGI